MHKCIWSFSALAYVLKYIKMMLSRTNLLYFMMRIQYNKLPASLQLLITTGLHFGLLQRVYTHANLKCYNILHSGSQKMNSFAGGTYTHKKALYLFTCPQGNTGCYSYVILLEGNKSAWILQEFNSLSNLLPTIFQVKVGNWCYYLKQLYDIWWYDAQSCRIRDEPRMLHLFVSGQCLSFSVDCVNVRAPVYACLMMSCVHAKFTSTHLT